MTSDDTTANSGENPYYIPPTAGPGTPAQKLPGKKTGNDWIAVAYFIVAIFVLIAAFQLYFVIQELIRTWISDQFVPVASGLYYILVIVVGIWLLRDYIRKQ
jgi:small neutral amino acid transporter SnatA (MarC family)